MLRKRFLYGAVCLVILALFVPVSTSHAQLQQNSAEIYVTDLTLEKTAYTAGDSVKGSFVLSNTNPSMNVPDVMYKISLVGDYGSNGIPRVFYDTKTFGPEFMKTGEQNKLVQFTYTLPAAFSGTGLGIHVRAVLKSGEPLGWTDKKIAVTGGLSTLTIDDATVVVDGKIFSTQAGPMIYKDKPATLQMSISNKSRETLDLTPRVKIYDRSSTGALLKTYDENDLVIRAGASQKLSYNLNTFDYKSGVYLGEVTFVDDKEVARATPVLFRYIVAGDIATITGITTQTTSAKEGDLINLTINYSGTPYDIVTGDLPPEAQTELDIDMKIFNERDELVGIYQEKMNFNKGTSKNLVIKSMEDAQAMRANVVIKKDGAIVDTYAANLSSNYDEVKATVRPEASTYLDRLLSWPVLLALLVVIIIVLGYIVMRRRMSRNVMSVFVLGFLVTAGIVMGATPHKVEAFTYTLQQDHEAVWNYLWDWTQYNSYLNNPNPPAGSRGHHPFSSLKPWYHNKDNDNSIHYWPRITVNPIKDINNQPLDPGDTFYVKGTLIAAACLNTPQDMMIKATFQNTTRTQNFYSVNEVTNNEHDHGDGEYRDYALGPFTAPSNAGTYQIVIHAENYSNIPHRVQNVNARNSPAFASLQAMPRILWSSGQEVGTIGGESKGYHNIVLTAPLPTVSLHANPGTVNYNNASMLTWSSTNATTCTGTNFTANGTQNSSGVSTGPLTTAKTYTISCTGPGGTAVDDVTVNVTGVAAPTVTLVASPVSVAVNENSNLTWTSTNATTCTASANPANSNWVGGKPLNGTKSTGPLTVNSLFTISCTGPGGTTSKNAIVNVTTNPPPPTVDLIADPTFVNSGSRSKLKWASVHANSCTGTNFSTENHTQESQGIYTDYLTTTTTYTISCTGPGGTITDTATVTVIQPPVEVTLSVSDSSITVGDTVTLTWDPNVYADSCTAWSSNGSWSGPKNANGGQNNVTLSTAGSYSFKITCFDNQDSSNFDEDTKTVVVSPPVVTGTCAAYDTPTSTTPLSSVTVGTAVTWRFISTQTFGGHSWSGTGFGTIPTGNQPHMTLASGYSSAGLKTATVELSNGGQPAGTIACTNLTVKNKPIFEEI